MRTPRKDLPAHKNRHKRRARGPRTNDTTTAIDLVEILGKCIRLLYRVRRLFPFEAGGRYYVVRRHGGEFESSFRRENSDEGNEDRVAAI